MASQTSDSVQDIFTKIKSEFLREIKDTKNRSELQKACTIDDIWGYTDQLQSDQGHQGRLRGLRKIQPYLERLQEYAGIVEVFVQVKPDILALVWGPIKLLLQMSSNVTKCFDAILDVMKSLGPVLPAFSQHVPLLKANERIGYVLGLYFKDILDFYLTSLKFFSWQIVFESLWPIHRSKIDMIAKNIEKHSLLMYNEITMETYVAPPSYDDVLDSLRLSRCDGTGTWLQRDVSVRKWLDAADPSTNVIWIQGIPGAGKTYLASTAIDESKVRGNCLFAFLSYKQDMPSPLPVFQSLLFQLASHNKDLRTILCSVIMSGPKDLKRDLKGDTDFTIRTLSKLLKCAGKTFIVIDGLDEIKESTQYILLSRLLDIMKECKDTRLLIVSRQGHILKRALDGACTIVRIDKRNTGCIQSYINHRAKEWLDQSGFDGEACIEIQQLLVPLSMKAQGMFLYARLILENIETLQDIEAIREELQVFPGSLDEIYERVLDRILKLPAASQKNAKRILSWIACSPLPITRHEMEQALLIEAHAETVPRVRAELNTLHLCGPLVDTQSDNLQFVHFTVKEYILNHEANPFIDQGEAILDMATTCITYLCSDVFDPSASDEDIQSHLITGAYRLFQFSRFQRAEITRQLTRYHNSKDVPEGLVRLLEQFLAIHNNVKYVQGDTRRSQRNWDLTFLDNRPETRDTLSWILDHRDWERTADNCRIDQDDTWVDSDPTTLSSIALQAREVLEGLLCPGDRHRKDCHCLALQRHYGARLYGCSYVACRFHRIGFEKVAMRDQHVKHHSRPFKCRMQACEYSFIGFLSQRECDQHYNRLHTASLQANTTSIYKDFSEDEIETLLFELVAQDEVDEVERLLPRIKQLPKSKLEPLQDLVACSGSLRDGQGIIHRRRNRHTAYAEIC
ncbi:hypothetical protein F4677DRAFT_462875 [Hypoxylon crocopeplum]|nr:hypothetical protein F4677DRAFT_462875 [Hypoxylon crocopeplum]